MIANLFRRERLKPIVYQARVKPLADFGVPTEIVHPSSSVPRKLALIDGLPDDLLADYEAKTARPMIVPPMRVANLSNATVTAGVVALRDGVVIEESLLNLRKSAHAGPWSRDHEGRLYLEGDLKPSKIIRERCFLLRQHWDSNYGHWLVEGLPRLTALLDRVSREDAFLVSAWHGPAMDAVYQDSIRALLGREPILFSSGYETVRVTTAVYPTPASDHPWTFSPLAMETARRLSRALHDGRTGPSRIYVSRNGTSRRRLLNEPEVLRLLEARGFTIIAEPEQLTLAEQVSLFSDAEFIVGAVGAALTNVLFSRRPVTLLGLSAERMQEDFFPSLMSLRPGRYASVHGSSEGLTGNDTHDMHLDFRVDVQRLTAMLDKLLASGAEDAFD